MSQETSQWLNNMILIGFTDKRGHAWHYNASEQGNEPNHYPGPVPVADVSRRLFNFTVDEAPIFTLVNGEYVEVEGRKAMRTSDTFDVLGIFKGGYTGHDYNVWLVEELANLIDDDLGIGSAGLLRNRGQAWVQIEMPDSIVTPEGVDFRPNLLATTSFDGTLATTFKRTNTIVVCDNTRECALGEQGQQFKVKHSKYSNLQLANARDALAIVHTMADDFANEIASLCATTVTDTVWSHAMDLLVPVPTDEANKRGITVADNKRATLNTLYRRDDRCAPWVGTMWGALQAYNTYALHEAQVRGNVKRGIRNMENIVSGKIANYDASVAQVFATLVSQ